MNDIVFLILLISAGQGVFLFLLLTFSKNRWKSNIYLGLIFLAFALQLFDMAMIFSKKILVYPHLAFLGMPFNLAFGPLLYFYIIKNSKKEIPIRKSIEFIHFLPAVLHLSYLLIIYHFKPINYKLLFLEDLLALLGDGPAVQAQPGALFFPLFLYIQLGTYLWISHRMLQVKNDFLPQMHIWLKKIWRGILIIGLFGLLQAFLILINVNQQPVTGYIGGLLAITYIYYGAMIAFNQSPLFFGLRKVKYQHSSLEKKQTELLVNRILLHMEKEKPYLDPDLSLKSLATQLDIPIQHLSQIVNTQLAKNFRDFLNKYRVEELKQQILNPSNSNLSLLGIAMQCGFNSKSTYIEAFKKMTGQTPSEYKKDMSKK